MIEEDPEVIAKMTAEMQSFSSPSIPDRLSALEATVRRLELWVREHGGPQ